MAIKFRCPTCHELFSAHEDMSGAQITCPMCFADFELPRKRRVSKPRRKKPANRKANDLAEPPVQRPQRSETPEPAETEPATGLPLSVVFRRRDREDHNELDMTPMVDVTFLLLIFFMVTAAFGLQKSFDIPAPDDTRPSSDAMTVEQLESDPKYVIVRIDGYDTYHVSAAAWEAEQEAPSKPDLLAKLRAAKASGQTAATHMLVMASEDATNGEVVTALDAGTALGMEDVKLMTLPAEQ